MKRNTLLAVILSMASLTASAQDNPRMTTMDLSAMEMAHYMAPAWNLGNTMEAGNNAKNFANSGIDTETWWQGTKTSQTIIDYVASKGFKSVRIPCAWVMGHITDKENMTIDPKWMARVKEIIDYCINANLNVMINDHWDGGWIEYDGFTTGANVSDFKERMRKLWTNIANALKDYDERVMFAGMNEPGVGGASPAASGSLVFNQYGQSTDAQMKAFVDRLYGYEQTFIDAVRATGGNNAKRILVVQGPSTDIAKTTKYFDMSKLSDTTDNRLMLEIHYYDPYQFCGMQKDESWGNMQYYWAGSPENNVTASKHKGTYYDEEVISTLKSMKTNFVDKGYPVLVGEYGAPWRNVGSAANEDQTKHNNSLQYWFKLVTQNSLENGLVPFQWDTNNCSYGGSSSVNRATCTDGIPYILNGINQGIEAGKDAFDAIYPEPSKTSAITVTDNDTPLTASDIYSIAGIKISNDTTPSLPQGIYIANGKKMYVK